MTSRKQFLAVSLKYPENARAPLITSKSEGQLARRMVEIARENNVPVVENDIAAGILTASAIGQCIPESTWEIVAKIFAFMSDDIAPEESC